MVSPFTNVFQLHAIETVKATPAPFDQAGVACLGHVGTLGYS